MIKAKQVVIYTIFTVFFLACGQENSKENIKAKWIENAFDSLESDKYPRIKAISWWHEDFDKSTLKVNSSKESLAAYKTGIKSATFIINPKFNSNKLLASEYGIYHSAFPDFGGTEDIVSTKKIKDFEQLVNKEIVWAYFSNNWYDNIQFPKNSVDIINNEGKIPFIRLMPRTNFDEGGPDPNYTMQKIIDGAFDTELTQWAIDAANTDIPLLIEFGTEVNGNWFPWNGLYNGAGNKTEYGDKNRFDGPERFVDAYRHIIDIFRANEVNNITWFFHIDAYGEPNVDWNKFENYYPGDNYIDWLGVSIYGPQESTEDYIEFSDILDEIYPRLTELSDKPIAILEFAITEME